ncbi:MAG: TonB family protein [Deltaproteobacteria bacterium]|nr:TonB family protein [Deltaproteobacteria bacterium]MBW2253004.1 TonB family protein [Deltaproteobacteria bacterium]
MGAQLHSKGVMSELNITPLVDIIMVVLIIMMVTIPISIEQMGLKLPSQAEVKHKSDVPIDQLVIAVYEDDTLALNRRLMTEEQLFYEITRRLRPMEKKNVFIDAHPTNLYGRVVDMMDLAREAGASKVGLARLKPQGPMPATSVSPGTMPRGVSVGLASVVGPVSTKGADDELQPLVPTFMGCYEQALARNNELSGRVMLRVTVAPDGTLMSSQVSSSNVDDEQLEACIAAAAEQKLSYKPLGEGNTAVVQYPILFSPG